MVNVLFVCLGNICRSPLAEGIFKRQAGEAGVDVLVDSAGTGNYHVGALPDHRSVRVGKDLGCDMSMRARQIRTDDFEKFDLLIAMDRDNAYDLKHWPGSRPEKVHLMRSFDPSSKGKDVPDPYYGDHHDFVEVAEMLEAACKGLLEEVQKRAAAHPS